MPQIPAVLLLALSCCGAAAAPLILDGTAAHHPWEGFGGLSAGASSRLLQDYPEPQRSDILDLLYKPQHGASLSICKIEIGGDVMSTDGTEPSHAHHRGDLSCQRGYELWLASEALARNPSITTFALSWGVPGWVGNGSYFSEENMAYQAAFATCFLQRTGRPLDYIGLWNERNWGSTDYVVGLRAALDAAGHAHTLIVLPDCAVATDARLLSAIASNATFGAAFAVAGLHGTPVPVPILEATGHRYWQSETGFDPISLTQDWAGARAWARNLATNYIDANITGTVTWSLLWSVLPGLPYDGRGIMMANTPWSGNFKDSAPLWVSAHWGQFLHNGWRRLLAGRGSGYLPPPNATPAASPASAAAWGTYSAYVPPASLDGLTLVVEAMGVAAATQRVFALAGGLPGPGTVLQVWQTTASAPFVRMGDAVVASDGTLTLSLPADGMLTASTVTGAAHGTPSAPIPPPAPLALPYADAFDEAAYAYDALPRLLSDQGGSFAVRNGTLVQTVSQRPGANDWYTTPDPITLLGDYTPWADVRVGVRVLLPVGAASGSAEDPPALVAPCESGGGGGGGGGDGTAAAQAWALGELFPASVSNTLPDGQQLCLNLYGCTAGLIYYQCCGGTCGCQGGAGFSFALQANGSLTAALFPGQCATVTPGSAAVTLEPCLPSSAAAAGAAAAAAAAAAALQTWAHTPATKQLVNAGSGLCLTSPLRHTQPYARVCARISGYSGFHGTAPVPGLCLQVQAGGGWQVTAGAAVLGNGTLAAVGGAWVQLELTAQGGGVSAAVGGQALGHWQANATFAAGMVAIGSGVHTAAFDDFFVQAV